MVEWGHWRTPVRPSFYLDRSISIVQWGGSAHALRELLLAAGVGLVLRAAGGSITHEPPAAPANPIAATADYVVQPGDTLWSVARRLQPEGDVRPVVDRLVAERGSSGLAVGEVIHIREAS